ncbi:MAG: HdeD family acid-resistance protein [Pseudomonadota bacterium]
MTDAAMNDNLSSPAEKPSLDPREALRRNRGWLVAAGAALILGGVAALILPVAASLAVELAVGVSFLVAGILQALHAFRCGGWRCRALAGLTALIAFAGGALLLLNPFAGMIALTAVMIVVFGAESLTRAWLGFRMRPEPGWGWMLAGGIAGVALAVAMIFLLPAIGLTALGVLAGMALLIEGASYLLLAFSSEDRRAAAG